MYNRFGPTPRICYDFLKDDAALIDHQAHSQSALGNLSLKALRTMLVDAITMNMRTVSSMLFVINRVPEKSLRRANLEFNNNSKYAYLSLEPMTHAVEMALRNQLWQEEQIDQFQFYSFLTRCESTMWSIAGLVFKWMGHSWLQKCIKLDLFSLMERKSGGSGRPQLRSTHGNTSKTPEFSIDIQPTRMIEYPGSSLGTIEPGTYYILESESQVAFDSFMSMTHSTSFDSRWRQIIQSMTRFFLSYHRYHCCQNWSGVMCLSFPRGRKPAAVSHRTTM